MTDLSRKNILVTGGFGFLGTSVIKKLVARGVPQENIFAPRSSELDLRIWDHCQMAVEGRSIVFHLAAVTGGLDFHRSNPAKIFYDNLMMGAQLMEAARRAGVEKFIAIGSATMYPPSAPLPFKEEYLWLGPPAEFNFPYSVAKLALLEQGRVYRSQYGFRTIYLILTNMYGPGDRPTRGHFIPSLIKKIAEAKRKNLLKIEMRGSGTETRDFLYVEDAAEGIVLAAEKYDDSTPLNLGSGKEIKISELVELVIDLMEYTGSVKWDFDDFVGQKRRWLDISRAEKLLGFKPTTSLRDGLQKTIDWYNSHP